MAGLASFRSPFVHAIDASPLVRALGLALALALPIAPAPAGANESGGALRVKPDADARRCLAATRRVERQREIVTEAQTRIEREQAALASCDGKRRACERHERALKASGMRHQRYERQLAQFAAEAKAACSTTM